MKASINALHAFNIMNCVTLRLFRWSHVQPWSHWYCMWRHTVQKAKARALYELTQAVTLNVLSLLYSNSHQADSLRALWCMFVGKKNTVSVCVPLTFFSSQPQVSPKMNPPPLSTDVGLSLLSLLMKSRVLAVCLGPWLRQFKNPGLSEFSV